MRILLVEDDEALGSITCTGLKQYGYTVDWLKDGQTALSYIKRETFDVVLLDLNLPGKSGLMVLNELRKGDNKTPILILTAMNTVENRVKGLNSGADDYVTKPFDLEELSARIQALQRRSSGGRANVNLVYRNVILDPMAFTVTVSGKPISVARREFALLQKLLENVGRVISREVLTQCLYGWDGDIDSNTLEVHIHNLRKKLAGTFIKTIRGVGYMVEQEQEKDT